MPGSRTRWIDAALWIGAAALLAWMLVASLGPAPAILDAFRLADKVFHSLHYALVTLLLLLAAAWRPGRGAGRAPGSAPWIAIGALVFGAAIEVIQGFVGRHSDAMDLAADAVGVAVALGVWLALRRGARGAAGPESPAASAAA